MRQILLKQQFEYMPCANRCLLCHDLYQNGYPSIICPISKEYLKILTLSNSDTFQF